MRIPNEQGEMGKYDILSRAVLHATEAEAVYVIVVKGKLGSGFSVSVTQDNPAAMLALAAAMISVAEKIGAALPTKMWMIDVTDCNPYPIRVWIPTFSLESNCRARMFDFKEHYRMYNRHRGWKNYCLENPKEKWPAAVEWAAPQIKTS